VSVQGPHDADACKHRWPAMFYDQQQRLHRGLPFFGIVFRLGQFCDVERGVAKRDQRLPARQYDRIEKPLIPRHRLPTLPRYENGRVAPRRDANHVRDYNLTGHVAEMSKSTLMIQRQHLADILRTWAVSKRVNKLGQRDYRTLADAVAA